MNSYSSGIAPASFITAETYVLGTCSIVFCVDAKLIEHPNKPDIHKVRLSSHTALWTKVNKPTYATLAVTFKFSRRPCYLARLRIAVPSSYTVPL